MAKEPNFILQPVTVPQLENHRNEDISKRGGADVTRTIGVRRDQGGRTKHHRVAKLVAAERDHDRDVSDYVPLPICLRAPRLSRELPSQETAPNAIGAVKSHLSIATNYTSIIFRAIDTLYIRLPFRSRIMILNLLNLYSLIFALFRKIDSMVSFIIT